METETTDQELVFDVFEVKRRDEPKTKRRRCRVAMPSAGEAAVLQMAEVDADAVAADSKKKKATAIADQMIDVVRSAMPEGLSTGELRGLVSGSSDLKAAALRDLLDKHRLERGTAQKGDRVGRLVLGNGVVPKVFSAE